MLKQRINEELKQKIWKEQEEYINEIKQLTPEEIISRAYEIVYREEIANALVNENFSKEVEKKLMQLPNPIGMLYDEWLKTEDSIGDDMINLVEKFCK